MTTTRGQHLIGKVLGSCVIERLLGYGGTSAVFLAQQHTPEQKVAIKVFLPRSHLNAQMQKDYYSRFLLEAEAASRLDHPNILPIYSYGEQDGLPYIIMPYMPGGTLSEYVASNGCLTLREAQWYLEQIAAALDYAHQHGCVHCDVKPANILLDSDGSVALSDFGIAHMMRRDIIADQSPTKSPGTLMGTPDYISPEQALGQPLDGRSDIYSLGITLFYLLVGRLPFIADSTIAVALLQVHENPPALGLLRGDITPYTDSVIQKALAKRPKDRFQTAGEFSVAFAQSIRIADQLYQIDPNNDLSDGMKATSRSLSSGAKRALSTSKPVVRVKPEAIRSVDLLRVIVAIILFFAIAVGAIAAGGLITSHFSDSPTKTHLQVAVPANALFDDLSNSSDWPTGGTFYFADQQYHIQNKSDHNVALALYANHQYANFHLTVSMSEIHGSSDGADYYGVAFRGTADQSHYYLFEVVAWGGGQYQFSRYDGDARWKTLAGGPTNLLLTGVGKRNAISVEATGDTFNFLINGKAVGPAITDSSSAALSSGEVGFSVEEQGTEIVFSHLYIKTSKA
ncbi:MAG: serine/threonine protein kinase [Chloroflexi bacterium]|nr:MAG: serine/threonine protein kinase [Chloroflexota bacterium]